MIAKLKFWQCGCCCNVDIWWFTDLGLLDASKLVHFYLTMTAISASSPEINWQQTKPSSFLHCLFMSEDHLQGTMWPPFTINSYAKFWHYRKEVGTEE